MTQKKKKYPQSKYHTYKIGKNIQLKLLASVGKIPNCLPNSFYVWFVEIRRQKILTRLFLPHLGITYGISEEPVASERPSLWQQLLQWKLGAAGKTSDIQANVGEAQRGSCSLRPIMKLGQMKQY